MKFSSRGNRLQPSAIRNKLFSDPELITFAAGKPAEQVFPSGALKDILHEIAEKRLTEAVQYSSTEGFEAFRENIAKILMKKAGVTCSADHIQLTSGSQQGIYFCTEIFVNEGDVIFTEQPSYTGALNIFEEMGAKVVGIEMDEEGMRMDRLRECAARYPEARMIYTIPDFQNPTGTVMSEKRRKEFIETAHDLGIPVVEDSPYRELSYDCPPRPALKAYDRYGVVIYLGSFSKTLCPGLRIGWICAQEPLIQKFNQLKAAADLQCASLNELVINRFLETQDWDLHIGSVQAFYRKKRDLFVRALKKYMPEYVRYSVPEGGFFAWLTLPDDMDAKDLLLFSVKKYGVAFITGDSFFTETGFRNYIRLSYSNVDMEKIDEGIRRIADAVRERRENR